MLRSLQNRKKQNPNIRKSCLWVLTDPIHCLIGFPDGLNYTEDKKNQNPINKCMGFARNAKVSHLAMPLCSAYQAVIFSSHISAVSWYCLSTCRARKEVGSLGKPKSNFCLSQAKRMQRCSSQLGHFAEFLMLWLIPSNICIAKRRFKDLVL